MFHALRNIYTPGTRSVLSACLPPMPRSRSSTEERHTAGQLPMMAWKKNSLVTYLPRRSRLSRLLQSVTRYSRYVCQRYYLPRGCGAGRRICTYSTVPWPLPPMLIIHQAGFLTLPLLSFWACRHMVRELLHILEEQWFAKVSLLSRFDGQPMVDGQ